MTNEQIKTAREIYGESFYKDSNNKRIYMIVRDIDWTYTRVFRQDLNIDNEELVMEYKDLTLKEANELNMTFKYTAKSIRDNRTKMFQSICDVIELLDRAAICDKNLTNTTQ